MELTVNGLRWHLLHRPAPPEPEGEPLWLLHGFTGSSATWEPLLARLGTQRAVVAVDLIGHGCTDAPADPARYTMARAVEDLLALMDALGSGRICLLGYSMGGRLALHLALAAPQRLACLILESASPGIADPARREARRAADEELATFIEQAGIEAFVQRWERHPLWASQASLPEATKQALRRQRLAQRPQGLAHSLRGMGVGAQAPLWERLGELTMPVLLVAGELDAAYRQMASEMARRMPRARCHVVEGAGHAVHLEHPEAFVAAVTRFLQAHGRGGPP